MSCELPPATVHGYFDGELDALRAAEFERHLEGCRECQASLEQLEALRTRLRRTDLYERASSDLRQRIHEQLGQAPAVARRPGIFPGRRFWLPAFAAVAVVFTIAWFLVPRDTQTAAMTAELIDAHVRSLQPGHLIDVQSTDQHTVKPWFDGKVDFIPPVVDYSQQGFPLLGGRLDVIDGHSVAVVVYGRRKHVVNLFAWPAREPGPADRSGSRQGYNWKVWRSGDMQFCLVSDASAADLDALKALMRR